MSQLPFRLRRAFWFMVWAVLRAWAVLCPFDRRCSERDGSLYYRRWSIWPGYLLTCYHQSDPDRGPHNHPWVWFKSRILRGCYYQRIEGKTHWDPNEVYGPGDLNVVLSGNIFHALRLVEGRVWSLLHYGPKHGRSWGFRNPDGTYTPATPDQGQCPGGLKP